MTTTTTKELVKKFIETKFDKLVDKKGKFSYAPWASAVKQLLLVAPNSTFTFEPVVYYGDTCMVSTTVTINDKKLPCILPCYATPRGGGKPSSISNPDSYELNTSYMRCLVKNIAMHGLGIDIYTQDETDEYYMEFDDEIDEEKEADLPEPLRAKNIRADKAREDKIKSQADNDLGKDTLFKVHESITRYGLEEAGFVVILNTICKDHKSKLKFRNLENFEKDINKIPENILSSVLERANTFIQKNEAVRMDKIIDETV